MLITLKFWKWVTPKNVSFVILMLQFCVIFGQQKVIIIDPGHGGKDTGAIGTNSIQEKDVSLSIAKEIIRLNETLLNNEFDMYSTRYKDTLISLTDRSRLAESLKADVFVSLHCNASNTSAKGMDVYVHNTNDEEVFIKKSIGMGLSILEESTLKLGFKNEQFDSQIFKCYVKISKFALLYSSKWALFRAPMKRTIFFKA